MNYFEQATRSKYRYETKRGLLSTEDLWDLPLEGATSLDGIAVALHAKIKAGEAVSFVKRVNALAQLEFNENQAKFNENQAKFNIVKHIIDVRLAEEAAVETAQADRQRQQRILELIADKKDGELASKSLEELTAMLEQ